MMRKVKAWTSLTLWLVVGILLSTVGQWLMSLGMESRETEWHSLVVTLGAFVLGVGAVVAPQISTNKVLTRHDRRLYFLMRALFGALTVLAGGALVEMIPYFKGADADDWLLMIVVATVLLVLVGWVFWFMQNALASNAVVNQGTNNSSIAPPVRPRRRGRAWTFGIGVGVGWVIRWMTSDHRNAMNSSKKG